ncbi:MAG: YraN family protein [Firmicutes bacterium]|nr:YraN family protein [Bacillota bacterium]
MAENKKKTVGRKGEDAACSYLERKGWRIVARNYRCRFGEIDMIAAKDGVLAFIEVKTRSRADFGFPREAVNAEKQRKLRASAQVFMLRRPEFSRFQPRMDVIEIRAVEEGALLRHLENAF